MPRPHVESRHVAFPAGHVPGNGLGKGPSGALGARGLRDRYPGHRPAPGAGRTDGARPPGQPQRARSTRRKAAANTAANATRTRDSVRA